MSADLPVPSTAALTVNKSTGAIVAPVTPSTFRSANDLAAATAVTAALATKQPLDADLTAATGAVTATAFADATATVTIRTTPAQQIFATEGTLTTLAAPSGATLYGAARAYAPLGGTQIRKLSSTQYEVVGEVAKYEVETIDYCATSGITGLTEIRTVDNIIKMLKGFSDAVAWNGATWTTLSTNRYTSLAGAWTAVRKLTSGTGNLIYDLSGRGKNLSIIGTTGAWADDGLSLDGVNDRLRAASAVITGGEWSCLMFGQRSSWDVGASSRVLASQSDGSSAGRTTFLGDDNTYRVEAFTGSSPTVATKLTGPRGWFGVMSTKTDAAQSLYSAGVSTVAATTAASAQTVLNAQFVIGATAVPSAYCAFKFGACFMFSADVGVDYSALFSNLRALLGFSQLLNPSVLHAQTLSFANESGAAAPVEIARIDNVARMLNGESSANSSNGAFWETIAGGLITGLEGAWIMTPFFNNLQRGLCFDLSANKRHLTATNISGFTDRGIGFNGSTQKLELASSIITSGQWSCFALGRHFGAGSSIAIVSQSSGSNNFRTTFLGRDASDNYQVFKRVDPSNYNAVGADVDGDFALMSAQDASNIKIFQQDDGSATATTSLAATTIDSSAFVIGGTAGAANYSGQIFVVLFWSSDRSSIFLALRRNLQRLLNLQLTLK